MSKQKAQRLLLFYIGKGLNIINKNRPKQFCLCGVVKSLPTKEEINKKVDDYAFRVPYDGSNNFYDEQALKHFRAGVDWLKGEIEK